MWNIIGQKIPFDRFQPFEPLEILYEFDGPRIFTLWDKDQEPYLAYWSDGNEDFNRYVIVPTSVAILTSLRSGVTSVLEALNQPRCWLCDVTHADQLLACQRVDFAGIPRDCLPSVGTMLLPELEPLLTLRAVGDAIVPGHIPGSVIRSCVEGVQKSLKFLSEFVLGKSPQQGRPDEFMRRLFDLPAQNFSPGSFVISFRMPIEEKNLFTASGRKSPEAETLEEVGRLLDKGLHWLTSAAGEEGVYSPTAPEEGEVLLRALKELTPASQGHIEQLELRGRLLGSRPAAFTLDREARQRVNTAIRTRRLKSEVVKLTGRIRELDKDRMSFELREIPEAPFFQRFVFEDKLRDDVIEAFDSEEIVTVLGITFPVKNVVFAAFVSSGTTAESEATAGDN
jgi:hypothetical protein